MQHIPKSQQGHFHFFMSCNSQQSENNKQVLSERKNNLKQSPKVKQIHTAEINRETETKIHLNRKQAIFTSPLTVKISHNTK